MNGNDLAHERKSETIALGLMRAVALIEFVENAGLILLGDDRAFVVDGEKYAARFLHEARCV